MNIKMILAFVAIGITFAAAITPIFINPVSAICTPSQNPAGNEPPGQLSCDSDTPYQNPSGNEPPGRNK